ncbi:hypothetical protein N9571_05845 [Yoonia sp.]|nr:hypothetical protein [Yoonia sp.]
MFDVVDPIGMSADTAIICPTCKLRFEPKRSNHKYCTTSCQKNASRGSRKTENKSRNELHYGRALDLAELIYASPPNKRLGIMKMILEAARGEDAALRNILRDPKLLGAAPTDKHLFYRRCPSSYRTISQAADAYCRKFFGLSVTAYLKDGFEGEHEVARTIDYGSVPRLKPKIIRKPKCWHCFP